MVCVCDDDGGSVSVCVCVCGMTFTVYSEHKHNSILNESIFREIKYSLIANPISVSVSFYILISNL